MIKAFTSSYYRDFGWNNIVRNLKKANRSYTKVGLPENGVTAGRLTMPELVNVGHINEFGLNKGGVARPFIKGVVDSNTNAVHELQFSGARRLLGGLPLRAALAYIGSGVEKIIKKNIITKQFTPNKPKTIAKKGFDYPLVETKQLLNSIQHKETVV